MFKVSVMLNISSLLVRHHSVQFTTIKNIKYWKKHVSLSSKVGEQLLGMIQRKKELYSGDAA